MALQQAPPVAGQAILVSGLATVVFPSRPYRRVVILVDIRSSVTSRVTIFRGTVSGAFTRITSNGAGANTQWTNPFNLPGGHNLFVQWDTPPAVLSDAKATITWMEEAPEVGSIPYGIGTRRNPGRLRRWLDQSRFL